MNKKIFEILQRYFSGDSTLAEEQLLQQYFSGDSIDPSLEVYRPLFSFFVSEKVVEPPPEKNPKSIRITWFTLFGIAAGIALMIVFIKPEQTDNYIYLIDGRRVYDESAAITSATDKLHKMSLSMQKAKNSLSAFDVIQESNLQLMQPFEKLQDAFQKTEELLNNKNLRYE